MIGSSSNKILCLNKDGNLLWAYNTNAAVYGTAAISDNGQILIGDESGTLYSLSSQGKLLWFFNTDAPIESPVLITDNNLAFFGNLNGEVFTLKLSSGIVSKTATTNYQWPTFKANDLSSGIYFYELKTGSYISTKKMMLLK